jgi:Sulfotransferase family
VTWALLVLATLATSELLHRLPVLDQIRGAANTATRAGRLIANRAVSDHWKERALQRYALRIAASSLSALGLLLVAVAPFLALVLGGAFLGTDLAGLVLSWQGMLACSAVAIAYLLLRPRLSSGDANAADRGAPARAGSRSGYSPLARVLHRLVLAAPARAELLFDLERATAPAPPTDVVVGRHVFVVGLARAGTTVLMRAIHESGAFASLTYRDMPFVMAPNLWARLSGRSRPEVAKAERAHGDGVLVDFDSPEALEEPFWRTFCGAAYIRADALVPYDVDAETLEKYRAFVGHALARHGADRYLAKNNNAILRLPALRAAFPQAVVLIPFRAPSAHAFSLMRQHERFLADDDSFTKSYMTWLAHHEFGQDHRPFVIDGARPVGTPHAIDYWLSLWTLLHRHLLAQAEAGGAALVPIAYEDLCASDRAAWRAICACTGIPPVEPNFAARVVAAPALSDPSLLAGAEAIYARLRALSRARLGLDARASAAV